MNDAKIEKPVPVRKARKGDCGLCHWWERTGEQPKPGVPWAGYCFVNPPIIGQTMVMQMTAQGNMPVPKITGSRPPSFETDRCEKWRPIGVIPDCPVTPGVIRGE